MGKLKNISVSFIVPYHALSRVLLTRCLDSIVSLGDLIDWEAWVVDDGTPDSQANLWVEAYADSRIHYHYQKWGGLSAARNTGLSLATKMYVQFIDSDDYLFTEVYVKALDLVNDWVPDVFAFHYVKVWGIPPVTISDTKLKKQRRIDYEGSGPHYMMAHNIRVSACGYLISRKCLGDLRFRVSLYHEDEDFTPLMLLRARRLVVTRLPVYAYFQRSGSIMLDKDPVRLRKRFTDMLFILNRHTEVQCQLDGTKALALKRRNATFALAILYELICQAPTKQFLFAVLDQLRNTGYYPLPDRNEPFLYRIVRLVTCSPKLVVLLFLLFRFKKI